MPVSVLFDSASMYHPVRGRSFDDSEPYISNNKQTDRTRGLPVSNLLKSFAENKEKFSSVAKIKVVVCSFFSFNFSSYFDFFNASCQ
jgi:kinesin family protein 2/24